jgi:hypothetical protein
VTPTLIVEHVAGVDDFEVAEATYGAAVARWPAARITLRQGARIVRERLASRRSRCLHQPWEGTIVLRPMIYPRFFVGERHLEEIDHVNLVKDDNRRAGVEDVRGLNFLELRERAH